MTVAQLKERMDQRFNAVDKRFKAVDRRFDTVDARFDRLTARMDAGFSAMNDKLSEILRILDDKYKHHHKIVTDHEERLQDLEAWRRTKHDTAR